MEYFIKLINGEKMEITFTNFIKYKNKIGDLLRIEKKGATLFIPYSSILFSYIKKD